MSELFLLLLFLEVVGVGVVVVYVDVFFRKLLILKLMCVTQLTALIIIRML